MQTNTLNLQKNNITLKPQSGRKAKIRRARTGFYSEVTRDNAFALSMDTHQPQKLRIYALLSRYGTLTRHQIAKLLKMPLHTVCARVNELMKDELVIDTQKEEMNEETSTPNNLVKAVVKELELFGK